MNETTTPNADRVKAMRHADALGACYFTPDGWCATHSTGAGPVYCAHPPENPPC